MTFSDNTTIFAQIYNLAVDFMLKAYELCTDVFLTEFPYNKWFRDTWAEFRILGDLFPGSNSFWYHATLEQWSTSKVVLILAVSFWIYMILARFIAILIAEVVDIFT